MTDQDVVEWIPLLMRDEAGFKRIVQESPNQEARFQAYSDAKGVGADILLGEILYYGTFNEASEIPELRSLYAYMVEHGMPVEHRTKAFHIVKHLVEMNTGVSVNAFLPFIAAETDRTIVSTATIDYVSVAPAIDNDPMGNPKDLLKLISDRTLANRGAVFGGLLAVGDRRLCELLWDLRAQLTVDELNVALTCTTGYVSKATVEFYLDWLETLESGSMERLYGILASGLALTRRNMRGTLVKTGLRPFPVGSVTPEEQEIMAAFVSLDDYTKEIAPRLLRLERNEQEPKVMTDVLRIWGLGEAIH